MTDTTDLRGRQLAPGQSSCVHVFDVASGESRLVFASDTVLVEAPNVLADGATLVLNGNGDLFTLTLPDDGAVLDETALVRVAMQDVPEINNDHVVDPSGDSIVVSARDGELYRVALPSGAPATRITDAAAALPVVRKYYLHGIAPDGSSLAAIVGERSVDGVWTTDVALVDPATGETTFLTRDEHPDDGCSFTPDGSVVVFNTERFSGDAGHAQLASLFRGAGAPVQITTDERVNWFPHVSPDGAHLLYLSYEPGTLGHPADRTVELRMLPGVLARGARMMPVPETLVTLSGGQGTINVGPWSPDSAWFAYCDYPVG